MIYYILGIIERIGSKINGWAWDKRVKILQKEQQEEARKRKK